MSRQFSRDYYLEVSMGNIPGATFVSKFGQNDDIGIGAFEDIWDLGGVYPYPTDATAPITRVDSSSASDTTNVEVQGLDVNGDLVVQTIAINGTTGTNLTTALWRVFRLKNVGATPYVGTVRVTNAGDTVTYAQIQTGNEQTLMALYTIPNGKTGYLCCGNASMAGLKRDYSIDGHVYMRNYGGVYQLKNTFGLNADGTGYFQHHYQIPLPIAGKTDVRVQGISTSSGGVMNATFDILLIDN